jgi:glycopeptide antibiotics resistance protein
MTDRTTKSAAPGALTIVLFGIYAVLLVAVILFKFPFQYQLTENGRELNLIPFGGSYTDFGRFGIGEVIENVLIFVPLGIYISMLKREWSFGLRTLVVAATSVGFEAIQYAFSIGRADITDVICNTFGGVLGIGLYAITANLMRTRTNRVLNIVALVVTVIVVAFFAFLRAHSK